MAAACATTKQTEFSLITLDCAPTSPISLASRVPEVENVGVQAKLGQITLKFVLMVDYEQSLFPSVVRQQEAKKLANGFLLLAQRTKLGKRDCSLSILMEVWPS